MVRRLRLSRPSKYSWRSLLRFTGYFLLVLFIFLAIARFIDFPVSMSMVAGRSMEPTLYMGDLVFGVKVAYGVGDIVVIEGASRMGCIVHRVVDIGERSVTTKGDANPGPDNPINRSSVLYKVMLVVPRLLWIPPVLGVSLFLGFLASIIILTVLRWSIPLW
jgi:signal peptidase I